MGDTREAEEKQKRHKRTTAGQTLKIQKNNTQEKHRGSRRDTRQIEEKQKRHKKTTGEAGEKQKRHTRRRGEAEET